MGVASQQYAGRNDNKPDRSLSGAGGFIIDVSGVGPAQALFNPRLRLAVSRYLEKWSSTLVPDEYLRQSREGEEGFERA